jgi:hypothetical protein
VADPGRIPAPSHRLVTGVGFSYEVPAPWRVLDPANLGVPTIATAQRATAPIDGFITNVGVAVEPFQGDVLTYARLHLAAIALRGALRDAWPSAAGLRAAVDVEGLWLQPLGPPYVTLQRYVVDGEKAYVITCAVAAAAYEAELPICEEIVESLRLD